jgi:hypothetical protein
MLTGKEEYWEQNMAMFAATLNSSTVHAFLSYFMLCIASCRRDVASVTNKVSVGRWFSDNGRRKPTHSETKLTQCHFVHRTGL